MVQDKAIYDSWGEDSGLTCAHILRMKESGDWGEQLQGRVLG